MKYKIKLKNARDIYNSELLQFLTAISLGLFIVFILSDLIHQFVMWDFYLWNDKEKLICQKNNKIK